MGTRWDFLDDLPSLDLSGMSPEQAVGFFNKFNDEEKAQLLADLSNEEADEKRRKRAYDITLKVGQFVIEKGIDLVL